MEARLLSIDLGNRSHNIEGIPGKIIRQYLGGRGLGAYLLYRLVSPETDPLGEENHLIFTAGPASGTDCYYSSKMVVNTKSPLTGLYLDSVCSGLLSHQMRKAGFWAIDIKGIADTPTYIIITNRDVEFKDAQPLWGLNTREAEQTMLTGLPPAKTAAVTIGPAGEKLVRYAAIMSGASHSRAFGRGGAGCVMGSKKLKGVVVQGDGLVDIGHRDRLEAVKKAIVENIKMNRKWADGRRLYGTGLDIELLNKGGVLPTRNWQGGQFEGWRGLDTTIAAREWPRENRNCGDPFCVSPCAHYIEIKKGPYQGVQCYGPEYETLYAFGSQCGVDKFDVVSAAGQICDDYGLDTMSAGVSIGFAMECFEKGLIGTKDTDGIELRFGNDRAMIAMLKKIADREGFGRRLGEGVKRLSEEIKGSPTFAMQVKGLELGGYECRGVLGQALQYAINNRGGCHHAYGIPVRGELQDENGMQIEIKGKQVKDQASGRIIRDCIPVCSFSGAALTNAMLPELVSALLGESWSADDLREVSVRVMCQERLFNMRQGMTRKDDTLPPRLLNEPKPDGPTKGVVVPIEELKDLYYRAMGWDLSTGNPPDSMLDELGIKKIG
ncbi:aldehyde ferredoxin oxidoreductase family protein [Chloroflexota bacterium]